VFANGGHQAEPYAFTQITNSQGEIVFDRDRDIPEPQQALPPETVAFLNNMLVQVPE